MDSEKKEVAAGPAPTPEVLFLVLNFLRELPCGEAIGGAVASLEAAALQNGLLPTRTDVFGNEHPCTVAELQERLPHLLPSALPSLLGQLLASKQQSGSQGLTTLLGAGRHALLQPPPPITVAAGTEPADTAAKASGRASTQVQADGAGAFDGAAAGRPTPGNVTGAASPQPHLAAPLPLHTRLSTPYVMARSNLHPALSCKPKQRQVSSSLLAGAMRHTRTLRGHRLAIYCLAMDSRFIVTGSDDWLVKVWCAHTGRLLCTLRGADAEINDLAINKTSTLLATADNNGCIRVWSLQESTLGHPVSVLMGHTAAVTFLNFSPLLPNLLLSSSFDGSCRIWHAQDPASRPCIVLRPNANFGALQKRPPHAREVKQAKGTGSNTVAAAAAAAGGSGLSAWPGGGDKQARGSGGAQPAGDGNVQAQASDGTPARANDDATGSGTRAANEAGGSRQASQPRPSAAAAVAAALRGMAATHGGTGRRAGVVAPHTDANISGDVQHVGDGPASHVASGRLTRGSLTAAGVGSSAAVQHGTGGPTAAATTAAAAAAGTQEPPGSIAEAAAAQGDGAGNWEEPGLICCRFSSDGTYIFASGSGSTAYVWHWRSLEKRMSGKRREHQQQGVQHGTANGGNQHHSQGQEQEAQPQRQHGLQQGPANVSTHHHDSQSQSQREAQPQQQRHVEQGQQQEGGHLLEQPQQQGHHSEQQTQQQQRVEQGQQQEEEHLLEQPHQQGHHTEQQLLQQHTMQGQQQEGRHFLEQPQQQGHRTEQQQHTMQGQQQDEGHEKQKPQPQYQHVLVPGREGKHSSQSPESRRESPCQHQRQPFPASAAREEGCIGVNASVKGLNGETDYHDLEERVLREGLQPPREFMKLESHKKDIHFIVFSNRGDAVMTGAKDGSVRIWRQAHKSLPRLPRAGTSNSVGAWTEAAVMCCLPDDAEIATAKAKRRPPQVPGINQISWSIDDRKVMASVADNSVRVWCAASGALLHMFKGHTDQVHVLEAHPLDPRLAMSAGYDGQIMLYDVEGCRLLKRLSTLDTLPFGVGYKQWSDPLPLVDGHWTPDGLGLVCTDAAGQIHICMTVGSCSPALARAPYDQWLNTDYNPITRDLNQWVIDSTTQLPPHLIPPSQMTLCDIMCDPYPDEVQTAYRTANFCALPARKKTDPLPQGVANFPPTVTAAMWAVGQQRRGGSLAVHQAIECAMERHRLVMDALNGFRNAPTAICIHDTDSEREEDRRRGIGLSSADASEGDNAADRDYLQTLQDSMYSSSSSSSSESLVSSSSDSRWSAASNNSDSSGSGGVRHRRNRSRASGGQHASGTPGSAGGNGRTRRRRRTTNGGGGARKRRRSGGEPAVQTRSTRTGGAAAIATNGGDAHVNGSGRGGGGRQNRQRAPGAMAEAEGHLQGAGAGVTLRARRNQQHQSLGALAAPRFSADVGSVALGGLGAGTGLDDGLVDGVRTRSRLRALNGDGNGGLLQAGLGRTRSQARRISQRQMQQEQRWQQELVRQRQQQQELEQWEQQQPSPWMEGSEDEGDGDLYLQFRLSNRLRRTGRASDDGPRASDLLVQDNGSKGHDGIEEDGDGAAAGPPQPPLPSWLPPLPPLPVQPLQQPPLPPTPFHSMQLPVPPPPTHSLQPLLPPPPTHSMQPPLPPPSTHSMQPPLPPPPTHSMQPPLPPPPTHSLQPPLPPPPTHSLQSPLPPPPTHSLQPPLPPQPDVPRTPQCLQPPLPLQPSPLQLPPSPPISSLPRHSGMHHTSFPLLPTQQQQVPHPPLPPLPLSPLTHTHTLPHGSTMGFTHHSTLNHPHSTLLSFPPQESLAGQGFVLHEGAEWQLHSRGVRSRRRAAAHPPTLPPMPQQGEEQGEQFFGQVASYPAPFLPPQPHEAYGQCGVQSNWQLRRRAAKYINYNTDDEEGDEDGLADNDEEEASDSSDFGGDVGVDEDSDFEAGGKKRNKGKGAAPQQQKRTAARQGGHARPKAPPKRQLPRRASTRKRKIAAKSEEEEEEEMSEASFSEEEVSSDEGLKGRKRGMRSSSRLSSRVRKPLVESSLSQEFSEDV